MLRIVALALLFSSLALAADDFMSLKAGLARVPGRRGGWCHGVLITPTPDAPDSAPAYVVSDGHCMPNAEVAGEKYFDELTNMRIRLEPDTEHATWAYAKRIAFAQSSVNGSEDKISKWVSDIAVIELAETLGELRAQGLTPRWVGDVPREGERLAGFSPKEDEVVLLAHSKSYSIDVLNVFKRDESFDSSAMIRRGSSGGPLISVYGPWAYGVALGVDKEEADQAATYSMLWELAFCFDPQSGKLDLKRKDCGLTREKCNAGGDQEKRQACAVQGCDEGVGAECLIAARAAVEYKTFLEGERFMRRACELGVRWACSSLGEIYAEGWQELKADAALSVKMFEAGCALGDRDACDQLVYVYLDGKAVGKSSEKAQATAKRACWLGSDLGCGNLALLTKDEVILERACAMAYRDTVKQMCAKLYSREEKGDSPAKSESPSY